MGAKIFAGTDAGAFLTTDNGVHWTKASAGLSATYTAVPCLLAVGATLFAGTPIGPYVSTNSGTSWTPVGSGFTALNFIQALATDGAFVYAAVTNSTVDNGVWKMPLPGTALARNSEGRRQWSPGVNTPVDSRGQARWTLTKYRGRTPTGRWPPNAGRLAKSP